MCYANNKGFTLIELLIVLLMMSLVMSLVAPMGVDMVEKVRGQTEYIQLQNILKKQSHLAFTSNQSVNITIQKHSIEIARYSQPNQQISFDYLSFYDEGFGFQFNANGLSSVSSIRLEVGNVTKVLSLTELWG